MNEIKKTRNFREYKVWQDAVAYATQVYKVAIDKQLTAFINKIRNS